MIENINIDGATVSAALHGYMYNGIYGYDGVLNCGRRAAYEIVSNNEIKIYDGLLCNQGRFMRISGTESVAIENGASGINRVDLIVAHFETDGINETCDIRVLKGDSSGTEPTYANEDLHNGGSARDLVLYAVKLTGLNITSVEKRFNEVEKLIDVSKDVIEALDLFLNSTSEADIEEALDNLLGV